MEFAGLEEPALRRRPGSERRKAARRRAEEFAAVEGFGDVVIGAGVEGLDFVGFLVENWSMHDDGGLGPAPEMFEGRGRRSSRGGRGRG